jgi:UDP-N-acetyl-D-mannosaminuronic acid dehydrogenase
LQLERSIQDNTFSRHPRKKLADSRWNKVLVVGLGEVGLPVAKYVKEKGLDAYGFDISQKALEHAKIAGIKQTDSFDGFGVYILCLPTHRADNIFKPQIESLFSIVKRLAVEASKGALISIESTVPRGTSRKVFELVNHRLHVAHVPHRWYATEQESHGVNQMRVAGGVCDCCLRMAAKFYNGHDNATGGDDNAISPPNNKNSCGIVYESCADAQVSNDVFTGTESSIRIDTRSSGMIRIKSRTPKTATGSSLNGPAFPSLGIPLHLVPNIEIAEVTKVAENAHRYLQIAFAEDLYLYCRANHINFVELRDALNSKWNVEILEPREGIGGHCLPKDTRIFLRSSKSIKSKILTAAMKVDQEYRRFRQVTNPDLQYPTENPAIVAK